MFNKKYLKILIILIFLFFVLVLFIPNCKQCKQTINVKSLPEKEILIDGHKLKVEIVSTVEEKRVGLSGKESLQEGFGMLFVFDKPDYYSFWMKNMQFSIDIIWIGENHQIVDIQEKISPENQTKSFFPKEKALFVLETNAGWVENNKVKEGVFIDLDNITTKNLDLEK